MKLSINENLPVEFGGFEPLGTSPLSGLMLNTDVPTSIIGQDPLGATTAGIFNNAVPDLVQVETIYDKLEPLGLTCLLAANDIHTIHINAKGVNFKELHLEAKELYELLEDIGDTCLEMACEDGRFVHDINDAKAVVDWEMNLSNQSFTLEDGVRVITEILNLVVQRIACMYDEAPSDIQSVLDEWVRTLDSKMKYFLGRILKESKNMRNESIMARSARRRKRPCFESLQYLKLGQPYKSFCEVEDHIEDYNCNPADFKKGDFIIRDFQYGHLPNGGSEGYIPYKVTDIVYKEDFPCEFCSPYVETHDEKYDKRQLEKIVLDDGFETHTLVVQDGRFNGMFHKLRKSSVKE